MNLFTENDNSMNCFCIILIFSEKWIQLSTLYLSKMTTDLYFLASPKEIIYQVLDIKAEIWK